MPMPAFAHPFALYLRPAMPMPADDWLNGQIPVRPFTPYKLMKS